MLPGIFVQLLVQAVPQLAPYAPLLRIAPEVLVAVVNEAQRIGDLVEAVNRRAPHLKGAIEQIAHEQGWNVAKELVARRFVPHDMTIKEFDYWTDNLNRNRG